MTVNRKNDIEIIWNKIQRKSILKVFKTHLLLNILEKYFNYQKVFEYYNYFLTRWKITLFIRLTI